MSYLLTALSILCGAIVLGSISIRRAGWLDRVVAYHKNKFFDELRSLPPIQIKATIEPAPPGYQDSQDWDFESVERLLILIRDSEGAKDVKMALRRSLGPTRRFMSMAQSFKAFPSLMKDQNDFYDTDSGEYYADVSNSTGICSDKDIIVVSNPVEARLPSASISVGLLKSILENRAKAARYIPTTKKIIPWSPVSKHTAKTTRTTKGTCESSTAASASPGHSLPSTAPPHTNTNNTNTNNTNTNNTNTNNSNTNNSNTNNSNTNNSNTNNSNTNNSNTNNSNTNNSNTNNSNTNNSNTNNSNTNNSNTNNSNTNNVPCTNPKNITCNCTTDNNNVTSNCNCTKHNCTNVNCTNTNCKNANKTNSTG